MSHGNGNDPVIRNADPLDAEALIDLIDQLNRHEAGLSDDRRTDREAARECLASLTTRIARDGGALLVCENAGQITGLLAMAYAMDEPYVAEPLRRHALITDLVVAETARGTGIGRLLMAEAEKRAREAGLRRIMITALHANEAALRAYQAAGYGAYLMTLEKPLR
jgi:GNAT superfamily N-acetyltransferase